MTLGEKFKDIGRHIIGQGEQVRFKNEVENYKTLHSVSYEKATKDVLSSCFRNIRAELGTNGIIDAKSKDFEQFKAALREVFGREILQKFSKDGGDPTVFRSLVIPPSNTAEINRVKDISRRNLKEKRRHMEL